MTTTHKTLTTINTDVPPLRLLTVKTMAEHAACSERTIRRAIADGELPSFRFGAKLIRCTEADFDAWLRRMTGIDQTPAA